jgi:hypothetical protein
MPPPDPEDDAALIERSWLDPEAFAGLYDRHAAPLHRYAGPLVAPSPQQLAKFPKAEQQEILRKVKDQKWPRKGTVVESLAYAQVSEVSGPGVK